MGKKEFKEKMKHTKEVTLADLIETGELDEFYHLQDNFDDLEDGIVITENGEVTVKTDEGYRD